jgi:riboflavin kinase/FMN adenylyltransferase
MSLHVYQSLDQWRREFGARGCVLSIGNFDGIHLGHQAILLQVVARARERQALAAVLTFDPHPMKVLRPQAAPPLIATLTQRLENIAGLGIEAALVQAFDAAFAQLSPEDFVSQVLAEGLHARAVLVGANFRFGHRQAGDVPRLSELAGGRGIEVQVVPPVTVQGEIVSSTAIREAVGSGDVARAARLLGRPFTLSGKIVAGTGTGRRRVVPTLNLAPEQELLPAPGVYVTESVLGGASASGRCFASVTNVGVRPTFDGQRLAIESHLLDFSEQLTAGGMRVAFHARLRAEQKFSGPEELRAQIERDIAQAREYFSHRVVR